MATILNLTPQRKLEILQMALKGIEVQLSNYICDALCCSFNPEEIHLLFNGDRDKLGWSRKILNEFPEIFTYEPKEHYKIDVWFMVNEYGKLRRIEVLTLTIKDIQASIAKS